MTETTQEQPVKIPWHKKPLLGSEHWTDITSRADLDEALLCKDGRFAVIDFYAGWCASCKSAHPALCKVATAPALRQSCTFYKANIENSRISALIKAYQVKGIPHILVFSPEAGGPGVPGLLASFSASFKKIEAVRHNLEVITSHPRTQQYGVDSVSGYVTLSDDCQPAPIPECADAPEEAKEH